MASARGPAFLNNAPWRRSAGRGQQSHTQSAVGRDIWGSIFTEELACLLPEGLAPSDFPPLSTGVRTVPKTRRKSEMFRQPTRSPTRSSTRAPQENAPAGRPQQSPRGGRPHAAAEGERNKRASAPAVVAAEVVAEPAREVQATTAPEQGSEHEAGGADGASAAAAEAPESRAAELQSRKSMRVLDLVSAGSASGAARDAAASFSSLALALSKKESRRVLRRELRDLADRQAELQGLLRKLAPAAAGTGADCDAAEQMATMLLVLRAAQGSDDMAMDTIWDGNTSDASADDGRGEWVLEPPHSDSWDWPLSRLERKERIVMLNHMELREDVADLHHQLARRKR